MTRVTGEINTVHRGIFEGATLFDFLRRIAALQPARPEHLDIAAEPTAIIQGPHGEFRVYPTGGALRLEGHREDISALTATIRVAGYLNPRSPTLLRLKLIAFFALDHIRSSN